MNVYQLVRDFGPSVIVAWALLRVVAATTLRLDYLGGCVAAVGATMGVVLPPPPPPLSTIWKMIQEAGPVKKFLMVFALVASVVAGSAMLTGCAAGDAAAFTAKRSLCALGDGVSTATRIWCNEPVSGPTVGAVSEPQRVRVEVVAVPPSFELKAPAAAPAPEPSAFRFSDPAEGTPVTCDGDSCKVGEPVAKWAPPERDWSDWVYVRRR